MANMKMILGFVVIMVVVSMGITPSLAQDDDCTVTLAAIVIDCNVQNTVEQLATCCAEFTKAAVDDTDCFCGLLVATALDNPMTFDAAELFTACSIPGTFDSVCVGN